MLFIARTIVEARVNSLIRKRNRALQNDDYDTAWKLEFKINKNRNRVFSYS